VIWTYTKKEAVLYVDSQEVARIQCEQIYPREVTFRIGSSRFPQTNRFVGKIKDVSIYDKSLSPQEIRAIR
jgi:hypothetical protein